MFATKREVNVFTIEQIKKEAEITAAQTHIDWDQLEDPKTAEMFAASLQKGSGYIPTLESLYKKLTSGKSVVEPDKETALDYKTVEEYTEMVAEELYSAYILQGIYDKYQKVNDILALSR